MSFGEVMFLQGVASAKPVRKKPHPVGCGLKKVLFKPDEGPTYYLKARRVGMRTVRMQLEGVSSPLSSL